MLTKMVVDKSEMTRSIKMKGLELGFSILPIREILREN